ncbi:hypothetical protein KCH_21620 [Kitasatospora cheerisanensis KCTC 2395]|uniref:Uncharacterized protein n=1 Tax=Kitasatospora cheerisanensis KCTC 2395 TaxID=1348663 RepID=A0A066Z856_9ACTN|nr:hypothetical protein KCH_21620 [Kitasatospora cheerisanensis KCTC 2395]
MRPRIERAPGRTVIRALPPCPGTRPGSARRPPAPLHSPSIRCSRRLATSGSL